MVGYLNIYTFYYVSLKQNYIFQIFLDEEHGHQQIILFLGRNFICQITNSKKSLSGWIFGNQLLPDIRIRFFVQLVSPKSGHKTDFFYNQMIQIQGEILQPFCINMLPDATLSTFKISSNIYVCIQEQVGLYVALRLFFQSQS